MLNVLEHLRLVVALLVVTFVLCRTILTARSPFVVVTALASLTAVIASALAVIAARTSVALWAWPAFRLYISLRFLDEGTA